MEVVDFALIISLFCLGYFGLGFLIVVVENWLHKRKQRGNKKL